MRSLFTITIFILSFNLHGQNTLLEDKVDTSIIYKNTIGAEIYPSLENTHGFNSLYSIKYERVISYNGYFKTLIELAGAYLGDPFIFNFGFHERFKYKNHGIGISINLLFITDFYKNWRGRNAINIEEFGTYYRPSLYYLHYNKNNRYNTKIGFSPLIAIDRGIEASPELTIGFGASF